MMDHNDVSRRIRESEDRLPGGELRWLVPGLIAGGLVVFGYLYTHPYPAFGAGLYFLMAERISDAGYALPVRIPYYTTDGVPFAYPPLLFYVLAVIRDATGLDAIFLSRVLPGLFTVAYLVPFYVLARQFGFARPQAGVATILLAVCPPVLQWHLSAGGIVRAGALLLALTGCYTGLRLFQGGNVRWLALTALLVGATALAHPLYLLFLLVSLLVFYLSFDRSVSGLASGVAVGVGGLLVAAPWWTTIVATHGWEVYSAAAGTHGGIGEVVSLVLSMSSGSGEGGGDAVGALGNLYLYIPLVLAGTYLVHRRELVLPAWFAAIGLTAGKPRFLFLFGALFAAALLFDPVIPAIRRLRRGESNVAEPVMLSVVLIAVVGSTGGLLYATGHLDTHAGSPSLPAFIDDDDREAMDWVNENTARSDRFVVLGDAAEWFPYFARRPILVSPWGVEWVDDDQYYRQLRLFKQLSKCERGTCLSANLARENIHPEYVYVPKDEYTVRGIQREPEVRLIDSLRSSDRYRLAYENDGVVVFRVIG